MLPDALDALITERQATATRLAELDAAILRAVLARQTAPDPEPAGLWSASRAARRLGISRVYLYELARTGALPSVKVGTRAVRFRPADLDAYAEKSLTPGPRHAATIELAGNLTTRR
jgi:excisionase family DNA binding protein